MYTNNIYRGWIGSAIACAAFVITQTSLRSFSLTHCRTGQLDVAYVSIHKPQPQNKKRTHWVHFLFWWEWVYPRYTITKIYKNSLGQKLHFYDFSNCAFSYWPCVSVGHSGPSTHSFFTKTKTDHLVGLCFWWEWVDSNHLSRKTTDLQSAPALQLRRTPRTRGLPHEASGEVWCGQRESNPHFKLGRLAY